MRGLVYALISGAIWGLFGWGIGSFYSDQKTISAFQGLVNSLNLGYTVVSNNVVFSSVFVMIGIAISIIKELTGRHHASGAPQKPIEPTP